MKILNSFKIFRDDARRIILREAQNKRPTSTQKRSSCGRSITPRARTSIPLFYQTRAIMSIIWPRLLIKIRFLRVGRSFALLISKRWISESFTPLILDESIMTF